MSRAVLTTRAVDIDTPVGRPVVRNLSLQLGHEQVALVGRNGMGKSTVMDVLAGVAPPTRGMLDRADRVAYVPQAPPDGVDGSLGERRFAALHEAWSSEPDLLLLDEPSDGLDARGRGALLHTLSEWRRGLVIVSHDPSVLSRFTCFWILEEAGCSLFTGTYEALLAHLEATARQREATFVGSLQVLKHREAHHERVSRRRARKRNVGRIHELDRGQSRLRLNQRRSAAQVSQAKVRARQEARITAQRQWADAAARALSAKLPLSMVVPEPVERPGGSIVAEDVVVALPGDRVPPVSGSWGRLRVGVVGPNGSGKSTLLATLRGERPPSAGRVRVQPEGIGSIAQGGEDWAGEETLIGVLLRWGLDLERAAEQVVAHGFPLALAHRAFSTLSPGERVRAALIALFARPLEVLVLDEPTASLDLVGRAALAKALATWRGGLIVASHDRSLLDGARLDRVWELT